jgi:hypothetical protein
VASTLRARNAHELSYKWPGRQPSEPLNLK